MKKSFVSYIRKMSKGDSNAFQGIFDYKFKKFDRLYEILKEYSSSIDDIEYYNTEDITALDVTVYFHDKKKIAKKLRDEIKDMCSDNPHGLNVKTLSLSVDESDEKTSLNISLILKERDYLPLNEENEEGESCNET